MEPKQRKVLLHRKEVTVFEDYCPDCNSVNIEELPTVNAIKKFYCKNCDTAFGVRGVKVVAGRIRGFSKRFG